MTKKNKTVEALNSIADEIILTRDAVLRREWSKAEKHFANIKAKIGSDDTLSWLNSKTGDLILSSDEREKSGKQDIGLV